MSAPRPNCLHSAEAFPDCPPVYFCHIPKTAGTSVTSLLDNQFRGSEVLSMSLLAQLGSVPRSSLEHTRLFRGHFDLTPQYLLRKPLDCITWLREPLARSLSEYHFLRDTPPEVSGVNAPAIAAAREQSLTEYLSRPGAERESHNVQCRSLGSASIDPADVLIDARERCDRARANLTSFPFFGLTERMYESLDWLTWLIGARPLDEAPYLNTTRRGHRLEALSPAEREALQAANVYDAQLYAAAVSDFDRGWRSILNEIVAKTSAADLAAEGRLHAALEAYLAGWTSYADLRPHIVPLLRTRFEGLRESEPSREELEYSFQDPLNGEGWHEREIPQNLMERTLRWTGPGTSSKISFKLRKGRAYRLRFRCWISTTAAAAEQVTASLNGVPPTQARWVSTGSNGDRHVVHEIQFPEHATTQPEQFSTLTLTVPETLRPCDVYPGQLDTRQLGVGIDWISFEAR